MAKSSARGESTNSIRASSNRLAASENSGQTQHFWFNHLASEPNEHYRCSNRGIYRASKVSGVPVTLLKLLVWLVSLNFEIWPSLV